jgi:drug/metabolite transporter (DMT)-like permease
LDGIFFSEKGLYFFLAGEFFSGEGSFSGDDEDDKDDKDDVALGDCAGLGAGLLVPTAALLSAAAAEPEASGESFVTLLGDCFGGSSSLLLDFKISMPGVIPRLFFSALTFETAGLGHCSSTSSVRSTCDDFRRFCGFCSLKKHLCLADCFSLTDPK